MADHDHFSMTINMLSTGTLNPDVDSASTPPRSNMSTPLSDIRGHLEVVNGGTESGVGNAVASGELDVHLGGCQHPRSQLVTFAFSQPAILRAQWSTPSDLLWLFYPANHAAGHIVSPSNAPILRLRKCTDAPSISVRGQVHPREVRA